MLKKNIYVYLVFLSILIAGLLIYPDYGFDTDEKFQRSNGFFWLYYVSDFFGLEELSSAAKAKLDSIQGFTLSPVEHYNKYGVIFDLPAAFFEIILKINQPVDYYQFRHLMVFLFFFVGLIFFYKILKNRFKSQWICIFGLLLLIFTPRLFGNSFFNVKDIVFLSLYIIALFYYFKTIDKNSFSNIILFSLFSAMATTMRIVGVFLPFSLIFFWLLSVISQRKDFKISFLLTYLGFYFFFLIIFWPLLWENTFENFLSYFEILNDYFGSKVLFLGNYYPPGKLPNYYLVFWILISTPVIHSILFLSGLAFYTLRITKRFFQIKSDSLHNDLWRSLNEKKDFLIFINLIIFFLFFTFMNVILYNGWRIAYFMYIFLIYFAVFGTYLIFIKYRKIKYLNKISSIFIICFIIFSVYRIYIYHPYQAFYFNFFVPQNVKNNVDVDYTGLSGIKFLREVIKNEPGTHKIKIGIASWYPLWRMAEILEKDDKDRLIFVSNDEREKSDYIYSNRISDVDKRYYKKYDIPKNFKKIKEYKIENAIIYEVYKKVKI